MRFGTTFNTKYCDSLGIDWEESLRHMTASLPLQTLRLCAYWDQIQPHKDKLNFDILDRQLDYLKKNHIRAVITIGRKVPRWPEFHEPKWVLKEKDSSRRNELFLAYLAKVIQRYDDDSTLIMWQIENEPFIAFGETHFPLTKDFFQKEIKYVRSLSDKPILSTESGEKTDWEKVADYTDLVGLNIYSQVWDSEKNSVRQITHSPARLKEKIKKLDKPVLVSELQAEPWGKSEDIKKDPEKWKEVFKPAVVEEGFRMCSEAGLDEVWFWGSEWWTYLYNQGDESMFDAVRAIMSPAWSMR